VILHDKALTLAQFEPARYDDPKLRRFAQEQVEIRLDPALTGPQAIVEIELAGGTTRMARCDHPRGSYENPLTRTQVEDKFRTYAKGRLQASRIEETIAAVNQLEEFPSVRVLMDLLSGSEQATVRKMAS